MITEHGWSRLTDAEKREVTKAIMRGDAVKYRLGKITAEELEKRNQTNRETLRKLAPTMKSSYQQMVLGGGEETIIANPKKAKEDPSQFNLWDPKVKPRLVDDLSDAFFAKKEALKK